MQAHTGHAGEEKEGPERKEKRENVKRKRDGAADSGVFQSV
jgi:hypothetical protein